MKLTKEQQQEKNKGIREFNLQGIRALNDSEDNRSFILSFSSEEPYLRWFGSEILDHSDGAVDLTRLNEIGCLLYNHKRDAVVGKVKRAWVENERGQAEVEFDTDDESEKIYQKVKNKTLKGVSVGYIVDSWEEVLANRTSADGKFTGPCSVARKWSPYEISIVSVPADPTVGVGRSMATEPHETDNFLSNYERQLEINKSL